MLVSSQMNKPMMKENIIIHKILHMQQIVNWALIT